MNIEPIIDARFKEFKIKNELEQIKESVAFEKFANYTIYTLHQPDAFSADSELLDFVSVGGEADMGIDGIAIKVNDIIVKSQRDIDDIIKHSGRKKVNVEFLFIQSKHKDKFDKGELNNFVCGVRDFLAETHNFPMNENVKKHLILKEYVLSDQLLIKWENNPKVILYYIVLGKWREPADLVGVKNQFSEDIHKLNTYNDEIGFNFIDSEALKDIYDSIQNTFKATIDTRHTMPLTAVDGVENSCLSIVYGNELLKLLSTNDGVIRKSLFNDNVRDFQGRNPVNNEIYTTIKTSPEKFIILNNGITIVCDDYKVNNTKISINNPQIVNGCQTSHIIFDANKAGLDVSNVPVSIRFISTTDENIVNEIVRGTNRQNIVLEEAFETTKKFHKDMEEFFSVYSQNINFQTIYYERRSKQYLDNPTIKQTQKINLKNLTQYFIGMFLNKPHDAHRHESILLKEYSNKIFQDNHSKLPYFVAAVAFIQLEKFIREHDDNKTIITYKPHLLMMFRQSIGGYPPALTKDKLIDQHSQQILDISVDYQKFVLRITEIIKVFKGALDKWEYDLGKSKSGTKDIESFTKLLIDEVNDKYKKKAINSVTNEPQKYIGTILNVIKDKYGNYCGFISKNPNNIFFHSKDNPTFDFVSMKDKQVIFEIILDKVNKGEKAKVLNIM